MKLKALVLVILVLAPAAVSAECPEPAVGKYPGWAERFFNATTGLGLGNSTVIDDYEVKVTKIFDSTAARIQVLKDSSPYLDKGIVAGSENRLIKDDLMIELYNTFGGNKANISVYTPQRADVTLNLSRIDVLNSISGRIYVFPSEEFEIELQLNNTGELQAEGVKVTPRLGDFEVISSDARVVPYMCPGSVETFKYRLKAPYRAKRFNFTLYFDMEYEDENVQLGRIETRTETYPVVVEINPPVLTVKREVSTRTLLYQGSVIRVAVTINNTGDQTAYDVRWADLPPSDLFVVQGTTSWEGNLLGGRTKRFVYEVVSNDPIACADTSTVTYKDRLGNEYRASSEETTTRFSPRLVVYKTIGARKWNINETQPVITINRTANITVEIKNVGNAMARNVLVKEKLKGLEVLSGSTSWKGDLLPDQVVSYSYAVRPTSCGITSNTTVNYSDVDIHALNRTLLGTPEGKCACYCTKTLEEVKFDSGEKVNGLYPDLNISVINGTSRKVIPGCIFDLVLNITANGSDSVSEVTTTIDLSGFLSAGGRISKGQTEYYEKVLKAKYYPGCTTKRTWTPVYKNYSLEFISPVVDNQTSFLIPVVTGFKDVYGWNQQNLTLNITVVPALKACRRVSIQKKDLEVEIDYANEVSLERAGEFNIKIKNTGFSRLDNVTLLLHMPNNIEVGANDSRWLGKVLYQVRRANDTLYVYSGEMEINESIDVRKEKTFPLLMSGTKAGDYIIRYEVLYSGKKTTGEVPLRVRGAIVKITKEIDRTVVNASEPINVKVTVENIGDDTAQDVSITDYPPPYVQIKGKPQMSQTTLGPGETAVLEYQMRFTEEGGYPIDPAVVKWSDRLGNQYSENSNKLRIEVKGVQIGVETGPKPPMVPLSKGEVVATVMFSLITLGILFKILTMRKPV